MTQTRCKVCRSTMIHGYIHNITLSTIWRHPVYHLVLDTPPGKSLVEWRPADNKPVPNCGMGAEVDACPKCGNVTWYANQEVKQ